jgi:hypothetical protein
LGNRTDHKWSELLSRNAPSPNSDT